MTGGEPVRVLLVEDNPGDARLVRVTLAEAALPHLRLDAADTLAQALERLAGERFGAVLLDLGLPDSEGLESVRAIHAAAPEVAVVVLTGNADTDLGPAAIQAGAQDFLIKGRYSGETLHRTVRHAVERRRMEGELRRTVEQLDRALRGTIDAIALAVEMRDPYTAGHERRVAALGVAIGRAMALPAGELQVLQLAGTVHDIGKIALPAEILAKPSRLSEAEFDLVKTHSRVGHDVLAPVEFPWPIARIVLQHHERMDGSGYPEGVRGDAILLPARILAVADVVEAMASDRPYRAAVGLEPALREIERGAGSRYDPDVATACVGLFRAGEFRFDHPAPDRTPRRGTSRDPRG